MAKDTAQLPDTIRLTRRIRLVATHLRAVGPYQFGQDYEVSSDDAARLVPARGFIYVDEPGAVPSQPIEE